MLMKRMSLPVFLRVIKFRDSVRNAGIEKWRSFSFFGYGMKDECITSRYCVSLLAAKRYVIINVT